MTERMNPASLKPGKRGKIRELYLEEGMKRRLQDMGMIRGACIECVGKSPLGDPAAFLVKGAVIAVRREEYERIEIEAMVECEPAADLRKGGMADGEKRKFCGGAFRGHGFQRAARG